MSQGRIYLDHNATTPVSAAALEAMLPFLREEYANPSSLHGPGQRVRAAFEDARARVAAVLGARPAEITFTSGGTESINHAIRGSCEAAPDRRRIVTSAVEHAATLDVVRRLERAGYEVVRLPVERDGTLPPERVAEALTDDTAVLSLILVNNETGVFSDADAIGAIARERGVPFHVDAVQMAGKGLSRLGERPVDLVSISGHKFGAPKGVGALWARRGTRLRPLVWGGHHETGRRGGTENVAGVIGQAVALEDSEARWRQHAAAVGRRRDRLQQLLAEGLPEMLVNGGTAARLESTLNVCFRAIEGAAVVLTLSQKGVDCSSGSACSAHDEGPSHVLEAMDVPGDFIHGSVRFSLSTSTSDDDIELAARRVIAAVQHVSRVNTH